MRQKGPTGEVSLWRARPPVASGAIVATTGRCYHGLTAGRNEHLTWARLVTSLVLELTDQLQSLWEQGAALTAKAIIDAAKPRVLSGFAPRSCFICRCWGLRRWP